MWRSPASFGCSSTEPLELLLAVFLERQGAGTGLHHRADQHGQRSGRLVHYAVTELEKGLTEDPAGVAEKPIKLNDMTRTEVLYILREAHDRLQRGIYLEVTGYPLQAHEEIARMFDDPEMLPFPNEQAVRVEVDQKYRADAAAREGSRESGGSRFGAAHVANVGDGDGRPGVNARSWAP